LLASLFTTPSVKMALNYTEESSPKTKPKPLKAFSKAKLSKDFGKLFKTTLP
jgi:hypothetical protein